MNDCTVKSPNSLQTLLGAFGWVFYAFGVYALFVVIALGAIGIAVGMCWAVWYMGYGVCQSIRAKRTGEPPMITGRGFVVIFTLLLPPIVYAVLLYAGVFGDLGLNSG